MNKVKGGLKMAKTQTTIKVYEDTKQRLFELKCAWRLHSFDETIKKLMEKASKKESGAK